MTYEYTGLHLIEVLGLILTYGFSNTANYVICICLLYKIVFSYNYQICNWASNENNDD